MRPAQTILKSKAWMEIPTLFLSSASAIRFRDPLTLLWGLGFGTKFWYYQPTKGCNAQGFTALPTETHKHVVKNACYCRVTNWKRRIWRHEGLHPCWFWNLKKIVCIQYGNWHPNCMENSGWKGFCVKVPLVVQWSYVPIVFQRTVLPALHPGLLKTLKAATPFPFRSKILRAFANGSDLFSTGFYELVDFRGNVRPSGQFVPFSNQ